MADKYETGLAFAQQCDATDALAGFKSAFYFPLHEGNECIYFCGNSLGLQPKSAEKAIQTELSSWREIAVGGYFGGVNPWLTYHDALRPSLAKIMGGKEDEITVMNTLTVNLHLLLVSFYRPKGKRNKILMEAGAFPSDQYAIETLAKHHHLHPDEVIIEISPLNDTKLLSTEQILQSIDDNKDDLALVMLGGINYYTGQLYDIEKITAAAHAIGAIAGFDLAHVAGNVPMQLHDWNVDFAVWCSYKYLNAGPGAVGGAFIHEQWASNTKTARLGGWWGNEEKSRFKMEKGFVPKANASGWNISTTQVFNTVCLKASLEIFDKAGMENIRNKSIHLTGYLAFLLQQLHNPAFEIITPLNEKERGAQLSLFFRERGKEIHTKMIENGIVVDYREPGVIRIAPAPLYCSYQDVYRFFEILRNYF
jgi:kynureninase